MYFFDNVQNNCRNGVARHPFMAAPWVIPIYMTKWCFWNISAQLNIKKKQVSIFGLIFLANHPYFNIMYDALQVGCAGFELRYKGGRVLDGISATQHLSQQPPCCLGQQLSWSETATNNFNNFNNTNNTTITNATSTPSLSLPTLP